MDLIFAFLILGLLLYSGVFILYFVVRAFLSPTSGQKKKTDTFRESSTSNRNQQRTTRRTTTSSSNSPSINRNANKQQSWRELASEFKDAMNELNTVDSKQVSTKKKNTLNPEKVKPNPTSKNQSNRSFEGRGSTEGLYGREGFGGREGSRNFEESRSFEGLRGQEGSASYEGTEFHPRGHATKKKAVKPKVAVRKPYATSHKVSKTHLQKNIVNAVIYKEILDQPRSKRPIR